MIRPGASLPMSPQTGISAMSPGAPAGDRPKFRHGTGA